MRRPVSVEARTLLRGVRVGAYTLLKDVWISGCALFNGANIFWNILVQFSWSLAEASNEPLEGYYRAC
jgi:hypothetical protein